MSRRHTLTASIEVDVDLDPSLDGAELDEARARVNGEVHSAVAWLDNAIDAVDGVDVVITIADTTA